MHTHNDAVSLVAIVDNNGNVVNGYILTFVVIKNDKDGDKSSPQESSRARRVRCGAVRCGAVRRAGATPHPSPVTVIRYHK
jgi:hypothetical protein